MKKKIKLLEYELLKIKKDPSIPPAYKEYLINKYSRCIKFLIKKYGVEIFNQPEISQEDKDEAISFYTERSEFDSKILGLGIMMSKGDYSDAQNYLNTLSTENQEEQDFIFTQAINLDYLSNKGTYELSPANDVLLRNIAEKIQPKSGYARALYEELTGERIYLPESEEAAKLTSTKPLDFNEYTIYPNPAQNYITLDLVDDSEKTITIYNAMGDLVKKVETNSSREILDVIDWENGIYYVKISNNDSIEIFSSKFIIIH